MRMDDTEGAYCRCRGTYSESSTLTAKAPNLVEWQFITAEQSKLGVSPTLRISKLKKIPVPSGLVDAYSWEGVSWVAAAHFQIEPVLDAVGIVINTGNARVWTDPL